MKGRMLAVAGLLLLAAAAEARPIDVFEHSAVMESLSSVHPRLRGRWLTERRIELPGWNTPLPPSGSDSLGLREVGRWSFGPSFDVDGRVTAAETLVALARGSGVSLLRFARTDRVALELLCDINAGGLVNRVRVRDTLLYVGSRKGLETWAITDARNPARLSVLGTALNDFALQDSFAFVISADSFKTYSIADPARPYRVGACRDSGEVIGVTNNAAFLGDRWGLYVVDLANPAAPHRLTSLGYATECVTARGDYCYITTYNPNQSGDIEFRVLNVADPATPYEVGMVDQAGGYDIELCDTFAYCSGDGNNVNEMTVVSVANPSQPRQVSRANTPGWSMGIWVNGRASSAFVGCHWEGLNVYDVRNPAAPVRDTWLLGADQAVDVHIDNGRAYVADLRASMHVLDISDPARPRALGVYTPRGDIRSVVARDSSAFVSWPMPRLLTLDVSDPLGPMLAGQCQGMFAWPEDMVLRDSFVYCAEALRFQVVNVARPREPVLVGSCVDADYTWDMDLTGNLAAVAHILSLRLVDVTDPTNPGVVGLWGGDVNCVDLVDTVAYAAGPYTGIVSLSVARPGSPYVLDSLHLTDTLWWNDIVVVDSVAFVGGERVWGVDVSDPGNLRLVPGLAWARPYTVRRLAYSAPYVYAACYEAGVCILEPTQTGVSERRPGGEGGRAVRAWPSVTRGKVNVGGTVGPWRMMDVTGKVVAEGSSNGGDIDLSRQRPGVYFLEAVTESGTSRTKLVRAD